MFFVNKNINHGGTIYQSGAEIKLGDFGFKELLKAGHINEGRGTVAIAPSEEPSDVESFMDDITQVIEQPIEELPKPKRKR
jgi:hypothetical protein